MSGFGFYEKEQTTAPPKITRRVPQCGKCRLKKGCDSPKMPPYGKFRKGIFVLGEGPGAQDDLGNKPFLGSVGNLLKKKMSVNGVDLYKDCLSMNAVCCRTPSGREPTGNEVTACRPLVWKEMMERKPKVILLMGTAALVSFLGHRWKKDLYKIDRWRGYAIPDRETGAWVLPIFSPKYAHINNQTDPRGRSLRGTNPVVNIIFNQDLKRALSYADIPFPEWTDERDLVRTTENPAKAVKYLKKLLDRANRQSFEIAFDYETSGLKPHARGHYIATCAISQNINRAFAFPATNDKVKHYLGKVLSHPKIGKIAHNLPYEKMWTEFCLGVRLRNVVWCTMLGSHVEDNREKVTGLKFQTYVHEGVIDYDSIVTPFLKSKNKRNANSMNRISEAPMKELLIYNALDALYTFRRSIGQREALGV